MAKRDLGDYAFEVTIEEWTMDGGRILNTLGRETNVLAGRRAWEVYSKSRPNIRIMCRHRARVIADSHPEPSASSADP